MNPKDILIIYGSLAPGQENHHIVSHIEGQWRKGKIIGVLEDRGWGAGLGYPGLILSEEGSEIKVDLLFSKYLAKHWPEIDDFEGDEYQRCVIPFILDDGTPGKGSIYTLR